MIVFIFYIILFILIFIILILLSVAFYTLMERKIISINQLRVGPNKILFAGILQPVFDGFKLFLKIINNPRKNLIFFYISPVLSFRIIFVFWFLITMPNIYFKNIIFLFLFGISVYSFVLRGWSSFSKFAYLGGLRASSQTVSYEVGLAVVLIIILAFLKNYRIQFFRDFYILFFLTPVLFIWLIIILIETNRAPFDFSEGERELISGFNIEYGAGGFVLFFLAEYSIIIFLSLFTSLLFSFNFLIFLIILFLFISMRTTFPRFRYDFLLRFLWFKILPFSILFYIFLLIF